MRGMKRNVQVGLEAVDESREEIGLTVQPRAFFLDVELRLPREDEAVDQ